MGIVIVKFRGVTRFDNELIALILLTSFVRFESLGIYNPSLYLMALSLGILLFKKVFLLNIVNVVLLALIFITSLFLWLFNIYDSGDFYRTIFNILPSLVLAAVSPASGLKVSDGALNRTLRLILLFYIVEALIRFLTPDVRAGDEFFYAYKYNSYMYGDSNFTALALLALFWLIDNIFLKSFRKFIYLLIVLFLILMTFSRAAYMAILFYFLLKKIKSKKILISLLTLSALGIYFVFDVVEFTDASLVTKFEIFNAVAAYNSNSGIFTILFGTGLEKFVELEGSKWTGHSIIFFVFVSFGLINSLLFFLILSNRFKKEYWTLYTSQLVASLSLLTYYFPYLTSSRLILEVKKSQK
jgi:hypothetical protein